MKINKLAYKPSEVCEALGLSLPVVYELINSGHIRSLRVGRRILVPVDALAEFLGENFNPKEPK